MEEMEDVCTGSGCEFGSIERHVQISHRTGLLAGIERVLPWECTDSF